MLNYIVFELFLQLLPLYSLVQPTQLLPDKTPESVVLSIMLSYEDTF